MAMKSQKMFGTCRPSPVGASSTARATTGSILPFHFSSDTIQGLLDFADLRNIRRIEIVDSGTQSILHTIANVRSAIKTLSKVLSQNLLASTLIVIKTSRLSWQELSILRKRYPALIDVDVGRWRISTNEGVRLILEQTQLRDLSRRLKSSSPVSLKVVTKRITLLSQASKPDYCALNRTYLHRAAMAVDLYFGKSTRPNNKAKSWEAVAAMGFIEPYVAVAEANLLAFDFEPDAHRIAVMNAVLLQVVQPLPSSSPWRIQDK